MLFNLVVSYEGFSTDIFNSDLALLTGDNISTTDCVTEHNKPVVNDSLASSHEIACFFMANIKPN